MRNYEDPSESVEDIDIPLYKLAEKVYNQFSNYDTAHRTLIETFGVPPEWAHLALEKFQNR